MSTVTYVIIMAVCVIFSGYFSATETAFLSMNKTRLKTLAEKGNRKAALACRLEENELREAINGFLAKLPEEQRNLFLRRYWYLDSIADIARRFACSESKVKTTLLRCRKRLREHLEEGGYSL